MKTLTTLPKAAAEFTFFGCGIQEAACDSVKCSVSRRMMLENSEHHFEEGFRKDLKLVSVTGVCVFRGVNRNSKTN